MRDFFQQLKNQGKSYKGSEKHLSRIIRKIEKKRPVVHMADTSNNGQFISLFHNTVFQQQEDGTDGQMDKDPFESGLPFDEEELFEGELRFIKPTCAIKQEGGIDAQIDEDSLEL